MDKILVSDNAANIAFCFVVFHSVLTIIGHVVHLFKKGNSTKTFNTRMKTLWVLLGLFGVAFFFYEPIALIFIFFLSVMCLKEFYNLILIRDKNFVYNKLIYPYLLVQFIFLSTHNINWFYLFLPLSIIVLPIFHFGIKDKFILKNSIIEYLGILLIVYLLGFLGALLNLGNIDNLSVILFLLITTLMNDFMQAVFGFLFGKHKISPQISPNKTIEGFIGGILGSVALTFWMGKYSIPSLNNLELIALGLLLAIVGFCGDITISAIKRYSGVKDSSNLLPGHGGFLDRFDSLLYTAPTIYIYLNIINS